MTDLAQDSLAAKLLRRGARVRGKGETNKEEEREMDEKGEKREKEHEADVWKEVHNQEGGRGNRKAKGDGRAEERQGVTKEKGDIDK